MSALSEWFVKAVPKSMRGWGSMQPPRPRVVCADGFTMSVQASSYHYCTPRENGLDEYTHVEIGFPSEVVPALMEFAENASNPTKSVYAGVPWELVETIVAEHGGIMEDNNGYGQSDF